ncbi:HupE/UreJ family protein [Pseudomonadota bacterium]
MRLKAGSPALQLNLQQAAVPKFRSQIAKEYIGLGFTHILPKGLDHILFVVGIFLLSLKLSPVLWQITAFTVAHTITLALTIYGYISLSPSIVEPLIALSIVYVGVENILTSRLKPWRVLVVFIFGLLHGMGFAGVLTEIGLPRSEFVTALITFNVGVELGQLAVIGIALLLVGGFRNKSWYRRWIVVPISLVISLIGLYWCLDRVTWTQLIA